MSKHNAPKSRDIIQDYVLAALNASAYPLYLRLVIREVSHNGFTQAQARDAIEHMAQTGLIAYGMNEARDNRITIQLAGGEA